MSRDILNRGTKVYLNSLEDGEAISIEQINSSTQTRANVSFKTRTEENTSPDPSELLLTADASTGKVIKYASISNVVNSVSNIWTENAKSSGTGFNIHPQDATNDNLVIGPDGNNNVNNRRLLVVGSTGQTALEVVKDSIFKDGDVIINNDANLHIRSTGSFDYIFAQNTGLTANRTINIPLLSNDGTMMIDETGVGLKLVTNLIKSSDSNILVDATTATTFVLGNTTDELQLTSKNTGVKLMPNIMLDSVGNVLLAKQIYGTSVRFFVGTGTANGWMNLASADVRLLNNQLSDSGGVSFINKAASAITFGNTTDQSLLISGPDLILRSNAGNVVLRISTATDVLSASSTKIDVNKDLRLTTTAGMTNSAGRNLVSYDGGNYNVVGQSTDRTDVKGDQMRIFATSTDKNVIRHLDATEVEVGNSADVLTLDGSQVDIVNGSNKLVTHFSNFNHSFYISADTDNRYTLQTDNNFVIYGTDGAADWTFDKTFVGSERRLKQNIVELDKAESLDTINRLKPSHYQYKRRPDETLTGFIVDEVEGVMDEMVTCTCVNDSQNNPVEMVKGISKPTLIPTLVSAIQKLTERITQLENIITANNLSV